LLLDFTDPDLLLLDDPDRATRFTVSR